MTELLYELSNPLVLVAMSSPSQVDKATTGCLQLTHINQQAVSLSKPMQHPVWLLPSLCSTVEISALRLDYARPHIPKQSSSPYHSRPP